MCLVTPATTWETGSYRPTISAKSARVLLRAVNGVWFSEWCRLTLCSGATGHKALPLQRQHEATKEWRQRDVLWFILLESLRMLSVPHEGSDESRLSVRHLIISQTKRLWCDPLTMAQSSLLTTVPTNNEEPTAATRGDGVVPTGHLRVRQIKERHRKLAACRFDVDAFHCRESGTEHILNQNTNNFTCAVWKRNIRSCWKRIEQRETSTVWPFIFHAFLHKHDRAYAAARYAHYQQTANK